jgi:PleD family two-component response regulator
MVQGLMAQSGGCLRLKSKKGEGTTAELWLPVAARGIETSSTLKTEPSLVTTRRKLSILAVDDDALVLMNTVIMLEDLGHSVTEAHSAGEAISLLKAGPTPDVVVTDHAMPQMTGAELAKIIQG